MTTVIAYRTDDDIYFASDSRVSAGHSHDELDRPKFFRRGPVTFGGAGFLRVLNVVETFEPPNLGKAGKADPRGYVLNRLVPALVKHMANHEFLSRDEGRAENGGVLVAAVRGRLFEIGWDFSVQETAGDVVALGSGSTYALGYLDAARDFMDLAAVEASIESMECLLLNALASAEDHDSGTGGTHYVARVSELKSGEVKYRDA